jgi:hypothetical protein
MQRFGGFIQNLEYLEHEMSEFWGSKWPFCELNLKILPDFQKNKVFVLGY